MYKIYGLKLKNVDEIKYIGYTKNSIEYRLSQHKQQSTKGRYRNACWVRNHKDEVESILIEDNIPTREDACEKEKMYIKLFKSFGAKLTNGTEGGDGVLPTKEVREKMSKSQKCNIGDKNGFYGKKHSDETKKKISESKKGSKSFWEGKKLDEETKKKIGDSHTGKKLSDESRKKLSESIKKWWQEKKIMNNE